MLKKFYSFFFFKSCMRCWFICLFVFKCRFPEVPVNVLEGLFVCVFYPVLELLKKFPCFLKKKKKKNSLFLFFLNSCFLWKFLSFFDKNVLGPWKSSCCENASVVPGTVLQCLSNFSGKDQESMKTVWYWCWINVDYRSDYSCCTFNVI